MKTDITNIHRACLDFLIDYQINHDDFFFVPRKINNKNRLEQGMYFLGNEKYLVLSFWDSADTKEFIYNINWCCTDNKVSSIELSCRDNNTKLPYIVEIKELLESTGKTFKKIRKNRWGWNYSGKDYLATLQDFITNVKPLIDDYLKQNLESGIPLANSDTNEKYVKKIPYYIQYMESVKKSKKTGRVMVKASEYIMTLQHNELSNKMVEYLKSHGYTDVKAEDNYVDIKCKNVFGEQIFFELKTAQKVKSAIREALGQLLEYNHYPNENKANKLIIVTKLEPEEDDKLYLIKLRNTYNIPIYYQYFDMTKKRLSEEF